MLFIPQRKRDMNIWNKLHSNIDNYWNILVLSIPKIAISLLILAVFILAAFAIGKFFRRKMRKKANDSITINFVVRMAKFVIIAMGIMLAFHAMGFTAISGGLLAGAGAGAVIIGFAFKEIGENFLSGIILVFDRPFEIGNTVTINDDMGVVVGLRFRTTQLKAFDGRDIYVPNSTVIRNTVTNHTKDGLMRQEFTIHITGKEDIDEVSQVIKDAVNSHKQVLNNGESQTQVLVDEVSKDDVALKVLFWVDTKDYKYGTSMIKSEVMRDVKNKLHQQKDETKKSE